MLLFFADDARQSRPSRPGVGPLIAAGAVCVPEDEVRVLELHLDRICTDFGFPQGQEFKWSPGRDLWMAMSLVGDQRQLFYRQVLEAAKQHGATATVVVQDSTTPRVTGDCSAEEDVTRLLLEGIHLQIALSEQGIVIADRPGGGRSEEDAFLASCLSACRTGSRFVRSFELIALFLTTSSRLLRLLQLSDLVTSCTTAMVAGENTWSAATFDHIRPLLRAEGGRIGGVGLKIYPPERFANLYYWILKDIDYMHHNTCYALPLPGYAYANGAETP